MKFTIEGVVYEMAQSKITFAEARAVERVTGHTFQAINTTPDLRNSTDVVQAMIWISMKRAEPTLTFSDLDDVEIDGIEWDDEAEDDAPADPSETASSSPDDAETDSPEKTSIELA
jgi:hypothetical protein